MKPTPATIVTLYRLNWTTHLEWDKREDWYLTREEGMSYKSSLKGEEAAEQAFHITNAPDDCLSEDEKLILKQQDFKGPSLSSGDIVKVSPIVYSGVSDYYMCKSFGWEKFSGDYFKLLRHLI
jgi:hypothetical protein